MLCETMENSKAIFWLRNNILWPAAVTATERENCQPWHGELCQIEQTIEKVYIEWPRVVNFITRVVGIRCVHHIKQKDFTAGLDAGGI